MSTSTKIPAAWSTSSAAAALGDAVPAARGFPVRAVSVLLDGDDLSSSRTRSSSAGREILWNPSSDLRHFDKALFHTSYPDWMWNTIIVSGRRDFASPPRAVLAAYAIERLLSAAQGHRHGDLPRHLVPPSILFIPLPRWCSKMDCSIRAGRSDPHYPTFLIRLHLASDGLFPLDPLRARGCALIDGRRAGDLTQIILRRRAG